jgi:aromatic-L-amino-acid decarboxylase
MTSDEFRAAGHEVVDWIADYLRDIREYPVVPNVKPGALIERLPKSAPEQGEPMEAILRDFRDLIVPGITHWNHPRFLAYFAISASGPGILGEMLAAALNVNHMLWKTGPAATELEQVTLAWLRQWLGLPEEFFGIIHDTASTGTLHAILAAREQAFPQARFDGTPPGLVLYCSEHAHSSVDKSAMAAGAGLEHIRHIATDSEHRMRPEELDRAIQEDQRAGRKPFCVVATVGTTSAASVDPVSVIAEVAQRHGLWLHVDAAYAGTAAILDEYRHILAGVERVDSLVVNPHKWLFTPVDLSVFYTRRPEVMRRAVSLAEAPPYLEPGEGTNLAEYSLALGRRFRSLKLWFVLRSFGRTGIAEILRGHMRAAAEVSAEIERHPDFELAAPTLFSLVCFRYRGTDDENRALLAAINASGQALLSSTVLNGRFVLRMAIGNAGTGSEDVRSVWSLVQDLSGRSR